MSLADILNLQQEINDRVNPPILSDILNLNRRYSALLNSSPLVSLGRNILLTPGIDKYFKNIEQLESIDKRFEIDRKITSKFNYYYSNYDLLNFNTDVEEDEVKEIESIIVEQTKSIKRIITDIYNNNTSLLQIQPRQFEEIIAELLYSKGFKVELTKQTRDNGYDIIALKLLENNIPLKFLVECKRYKENKVGIEIIRSFKEVVQAENANKGMIVTTSYFTRDAKKKREETPYLLDYRDKDDVLSWIKEYSTK